MFLLRNRKCKSVAAKNGINGLLNVHKCSSPIASQRSSSYLRKFWNARRVEWPNSSNGIRSLSSIENTEGYQPNAKYASCDLPSQIKVVICGGGVMGAAVAYHLALLGQGAQTVILEQGR